MKNDLIRRLSNRLHAAKPARASAPSQWDELDESELAVAGLLGQYARVCLSPSRDTLSRVRSVTLSAAAAAAASAPETGRVRSRMGARPAAAAFHPRLAAAVAAIALLLVSSAAFAASQSGPGQPFYHLRLDLEAAGLPPAGSTARVDADMDRAQARLNDIASAVARHDWNAAADAADAYSDVVTPMTPPRNAQALAQFQANMTRQLARLQALEADSKAQATTALDNAIARLTALLESSQATSQPTDDPCKQTGPDKAKPTPGTGNAGNACKSPDPGSTVKPTKAPSDTEAPPATPRPTPPKTPPGQGKG